MKCSLHLLLLLPVPVCPAAAEDLVPEWAFMSGDIVFSSPAIGPLGGVHFGSRDGNLYCVNPDGSARWIFKEAGDWIDSSPSVGADGSVYVGSWDHFFYALNPEGSLRWSYATGSAILGSPALDGKGRVYTGSMDGFMYSFSATDGSLRWIYPDPATTLPEGGIEAGPVLDSDGDTLYYGNDNGTFRAVATADGSLLWSFDVASVHPPDGATSIGFANAAALDEAGNVYVACQNGYLYALDGEDGRLRWSFPATEGILASPAVTEDGTVVFPSKDGYLYGVDLEGFQVFESFIGDVFYCSPALDAEGNIVIAGYSGSAETGESTTLFVLDAEGTPLREFILDDYNDSSPNLAPDGSLYIGAHDGNLYKFSGGAELQQNAPWPRKGGSRYQNGFSETNRHGDLLDSFPAIEYAEDGWARLSWFGSGWMRPEGLPWIRHLDHGYLYTLPDPPQASWFYDPSLGGYLYNAADLGNYLYRAAPASWLFHVPGTTVAGERWFFEFATSAWLTTDP